MKKIIVLLTLFIVLNSCSKEDDTQYSFKLMAIESVDIPTEFTLGETYPITIHYTAPTSCYLFNYFYYEKDLNIRTIAIENAIANRNDCQDLNPENSLKSYTFNFYVTSNGSYIFKFYQGKNSEGNSIFLEYEIPVTN
jgi:hypothetical protein